MKKPMHSKILVYIFLFVFAYTIVPTVLHAQYYGRNKVQYENFDFKILKTEHFDVYFYPEMREAAQQAARRPPHRERPPPPHHEARHGLHASARATSLRSLSSDGSRARAARRSAMSPEGNASGSE